MTTNKTKLSIALGSALVATMSVSAVAETAQNPFAMASLDKGYMVAAADTAKDGKMKDGKCGEGKCGAAKEKAAKAVAEKAKMQEGKCGEGKCGAAKK